MNIVFCTTCKGRLQHLRQTLPQNIADNSLARFVVLDYNSQDGLVEYLKECHARDILSGKLVVYSYRDSEVFRMAHAKNMVHRLAVLEGAEIIITLDADNYTHENFDQYILARFTNDKNFFLCPRIVALGTGPVRIQPRGVAGRLVVRAQEFIKAGGYDEKYITWRGEDVDLVARLRRMGYAARFIPPAFLDAIWHGNDIRFKEYPHAEQYQTDQVVSEIYKEKHTLANFGNFGCGIVFKNFMPEPIEVKPMPTRIFGIGLHRTATTSLHTAFELLGFDAFHWESGDKARDIWDEMNATKRSWMLERYYALSDNPIPLLYAQLDESYPGSKFILTIRDENEWLASVARLWNPHYNRNRWEWDVYPISNRIHRALYGRSDFDAPTFLARYRQHNAEVLAHFRNRPGDLLVMNMSAGAGWLELCKFLDKPIPNQPYPERYHTSNG